MFPWQPFLFRSLPFLGVKVPQQLYWADDSTLLLGPLNIWMLPKECGCWPVAVPRAAHPPRLCAEGSDAGSQRVPLLTGMNANGGADAGHKRRLENRLMVRRRERSRPAWPGSSKNFRVGVKVTINIVARLRASRQYQDPDLTGRRGSFTRSSLLFAIGQIRKNEATPQFLARIFPALPLYRRDDDIAKLSRHDSYRLQIHTK